MIARLVVALCAALPLSALAFSSTSSANQTTFTGFTATPSNVGAYTLSTATDGRVLIKSPQRLTVGGGGSIPIDVTGGVAKPTVIGAIGRFLAKGTGVVGVVALGVGVYDLAQELNFILGNDGDTITVIAPPHPSTAQNLDYRHSSADDWSKSIVPACIARAQSLNNSVQSVVYDTWTPQANCRLRRTSIPGGAVDFIFSAVETRTQVGPDPGAGPATIAELEQAINEKQSWTVTSALNRALLDAVKSGEQVAVTSPVTSGPASAPVSTTTTVDPQTGNTTTTVVTINNTYSGPSVTTTTATTTSVKNTGTNAPVGSPVTSTVAGPVSTSPTTAEPAAEPEAFAMPCGIAGTPPCAVKVDEAGTPTTVAELIDPQSRGEEVTAPIDPVVSNPEGFWPSLPTLSWAFSLPSGCSVIALPAFSPWLSAIDVCEFQPMFHDLMTVVWSVGALLGLVSLFWRNVFAGVPA